MRYPWMGNALVHHRDVVGEHTATDVIGIATERVEAVGDDADPDARAVDAVGAAGHVGHERDVGLVEIHIRRAEAGRRETATRFERFCPQAGRPGAVWPRSLASGAMTRREAHGVLVWKDWTKLRLQVSGQNPLAGSSLGTRPWSWCRHGHDERTHGRCAHRVGENPLSIRDRQPRGWRDPTALPGDGERVPHTARAGLDDMH